MKQVLILSGKGGTGKTTIASGLIKLSHAESFADCDVDAPNLHLMMDFKTEAFKSDFYGMPKAFIDNDLCIKCGKCQIYCRFGAIMNEDAYRVNPTNCEGCAVCELVCPVKAIHLKTHVSGRTTLYKEGPRVFSTAELNMGSGNSGKLVTEVKKQLTNQKREGNISFIDGSPGIGCPVIASISGVDLVLIVAEPSVSGLSDMLRLIETTRKLGVEMLVCINKYDINEAITGQIKALCDAEKIEYIGRIPFDSKAVEAINKGMTIVEMSSPSGDALKAIYEKLKTKLASLESHPPIITPITF